jgi:hypothetical protein
LEEVSWKEAHVARAVASVPAPIVERVIVEAKARGEAPTVAALLREAKAEQRRDVAEARRAAAGSDAESGHGHVDGASMTRRRREQAHAIRVES